MSKKNNSDSFEFYGNFTSFFNANSSGLTENDFEYHIIAEGLTHLFKTSDSGLTVLWPNKDLVKKIKELRHNEKTLFEAQKLIASLFIPKFITTSKDFNNCITKSGEKLVVTKPDDKGVVTFSNGTKATYNPKYRATPFFRTEKNKNQQNFAIWEISKFGTTGGSDSGVCLKKVFVFLEKLSHHGKSERISICEKIVGKLAVGEAKYLMQGFPIAELLILVCTNIFGDNFANFQAIDTRNLPPNDYKVCDDKQYVISGQNFERPVDIYGFYEEIKQNCKYNGIPFGPEPICQNLFAIQEFFYKMDFILKKSSYNFLEIFSSICLLNCRVMSGNFLPTGFIKIGKEESQNTLKLLFNIYGDYFVVRKNRNFYGGNEVMKNHILKLINNLDNKEKEEIKNSI